MDPTWISTGIHAATIFVVGIGFILSMREAIKKLTETVSSLHKTVNELHTTVKSHNKELADHDRRIRDLEDARQ